MRSDENELKREVGYGMMMSRMRVVRVSFSESSMEGATGHSAGRMVAKIRSQQTTKTDPKIRVKAPRVDLKSDLDVMGTS